MAPVIRVSEDTYQRLQKYTLLLGGSYEMVIVRLLGFFESQGGSNSPSQSPASTRGSQLGKTSAEHSHSRKVEIPLRIHTAKTYSLIPVPKKARRFFPGFKNAFVLETDVGEMSVWVSSGPEGTKPGDPNAGGYIVGSDKSGRLRNWYERHPDLKDGSVLLVEQIEEGKRYRLGIKTEQV